MVCKYVNLAITGIRLGSHCFYFRVRAQVGMLFISKIVFELTHSAICLQAAMIASEMIGSI